MEFAALNVRLDSHAYGPIVWTLLGLHTVGGRPPPSPLFEAALRSDAVHFLQHASFLATALLFCGPCPADGAAAGAPGAQSSHLSAPWPASLRRATRAAALGSARLNSNCTA